MAFSFTFSFYGIKAYVLHDKQLLRFINSVNMIDIGPETRKCNGQLATFHPEESTNEFNVASDVYQVDFTSK